VRAREFAQRYVERFPAGRWLRDAQRILARPQ
jgi:hypothetical protein